MTRALAHQLNQDCFCVGVDRPALADAIECDVTNELIAARPHVFSESPVFLARDDITAMMEIVAGAEAAARLPGFREAVLGRAPEIAQADHGPLGAFMGYDFHLDAGGAKLIEINTNAGGAFLNAFLARAQRVCCGAKAAPPMAEDFDTAALDMFEREWRLQRGDATLRRIAIVDDAPTEKYLYPEFLLARRLLERARYETRIIDPTNLRYERGALRHEGEAIDLVYNRLVDFSFEHADHAALRQAYSDGAVVVTPNPHRHALHADKRNLVSLADAKRLAEWGLSAREIGLLRNASDAVEVTPANAEALWMARRRYFFKPFAGHGGKAVYRGDKLTKGVWASIRNGGYIAQTLAPASERLVRVGAERRACKVDVRLYTYDGRPLLAAARLYQGQTTNFRTPGGGFAPVLVV